MTLLEFKEKFPNHDLMTQMIYPKSQGFESWLCFHNYFERVLKRPMLVDLYTFSFDSSGTLIESQKTEVKSDESVQVLVNKKIGGFGVVCCAAVPKISSEELMNSPFVMKTPQSTGYYMLWENKSNNSIDTSHEWDPVCFSTRKNATYTVCMPASPFISKRSLFLYNPHASRPATCSMKGGFNGSLELGPLCGQEVLMAGPDDRDIVCVIEGPISAPMTLEQGVSGDVHVHHS